MRLTDLILYSIEAAVSYKTHELLLSDCVEERERERSPEGAVHYRKCFE